MVYISIHGRAAGDSQFTVVAVLPAFFFGKQGKIDISAHCRGQIVIGSLQSVMRGHAQALSIGPGNPKNIGAPIVICDAPGDEKPIRQAVEILQGSGIDCLLPGQFYSHPFCAA